MKKIFRLSALSLLLYSFLSAGAQDALIQNYTDLEWDPTTIWKGDGDPQGATGDPYTFSLSDCMLKIDCQGGLLPGGMAVRFVPEALIDMSANPYILMAMKAPQEVTVRIHMMNSSWAQNSPSSPGSTIAPVEFTFGGESDTLTPYLFDFSDPATMGALSLADVKWLIFEFDQAYGDSENYPWDDAANWADVAWEGTIFVDYMQVAGADILQKYTDYKRIPCVQAINRDPLLAIVDEAYDLYDNSEEGTEPGQYATGSRTTLSSAIEEAEKVLAKTDEELTQLELDDAVVLLAGAIDTFKNEQIVGFDELNNLINSAETLLAGAVEGTVAGEYMDGSKAVLQAKVDDAKAVAGNAESTVDEMTLAIANMTKAVFDFNNTKLHGAIFSNDSYFGNMANYQFLNDTSWKTNEVDGDLCLSLQIKGTPIIAQSILDQDPSVKWWDAAAYAALGQFGYLKDSIYQDFIFELEMQKPSYQENENFDMTVVFGIEDNTNYNYLQLTAKPAGVRISSVDDGIRTTVDLKEELPENFLPDHEFHLVEIERTSNTIAFSYEGDEQLVYTNDTLDFSEPGFVGIGAWNDMGNFDNLQVWRKASVGIEMPNLEDMKIYPIPASDLIHISGMKGVDEINVYNILGSQVINLSAGQNEHISVNTSSLDQGIYLIQFMIGNSIADVRRLSIVR